MNKIGRPSGFQADLFHIATRIWEKGMLLPRILSVSLGLFCTFGIVACGGGGGGNAAPPVVGSGSGGGTTSNVVTLRILVSDVTQAPIEGAEVTVTSAGTQHQATSDANGAADFKGLARGEADLVVSAAGFESANLPGITLATQYPRQSISIRLNANGAWAVGRAVVLGTRLIDLATDGTAMTFELDMAVIGENSDALQTLTSADFSIVTFDCGWSGPRECASDAAGNATGNEGNFSPDGGAQLFGLQPSPARRPYLVDVLAERSSGVTDWDEKVPALNSFFAAIGGNDLASLESVQVVGGATTLTVHGPFTSDGSTYADAINDLAIPAGSAPELPDSLGESIRRAAAAANGSGPGHEPTVLALATQWMTVSEIDEASSLARQLGVRISTVQSYAYGFPEMAVRTGGFVAEVDDQRQLGMIFGAMDGLLAGTTPYYRMQFRITGVPGTFVSGGNAKIYLRVDVPTSLPHRGVYTSLDVAIP